MIFEVDINNLGATQEGGALAPLTLDEVRRYFGETILDEATTIEQHRGMFMRYVMSEEGIKAELSRLKVDQLRGGYYGLERMRKPELVAWRWRKMLEDFYIGPALLGVPGEVFRTGKWAEFYEPRVAALTAEDLTAYRARRRESDEERKRRVEHYRKSVENPETREEFELFCRVKGESQLTDEQLARFDALRGDMAVERRARELVEQATVRRVAGIAGLTLEIVRRRHDRRGCDVWIVTLSEKVDRATFEELCIAARKLGGNYSRAWRPTNSPAGFMFEEEAKAEEFVRLQHGDVQDDDRLAKIVGRRERVQDNAADHFDALAGTMAERAGASLAAPRLTNTPRRVELARVAEERALDTLQMAGTLTTTAARLRARTARMLERIRWRTHAETFEALLRRADFDVRSLKYPHPEVGAGVLEQAAERLKDVDGCVLISRRILKMVRASQSARSYLVTFTHPADVKALEDFYRKLRLHGRVSRHVVEAIRDGLADYKRLRLMRIANLPELREAAREHVANRAARRARSAYIAERLEEELPGFFPTPRDVVKLMLAYAQMEEEMFWCEPSAGAGHIVSVVRSYFKRTRYDLVEIRDRLRAELYERGYWDKGREMARDFTAFNPWMRAGFEGYDVILANPPFEHGQDIDHVRRMYAQLNEGRGRLVSVMSESAFAGLADDEATGEELDALNRKKREFRDWLKAVGGASVQLPEGSFLRSERPVDVSTRLVVIDRGAPAEAVAA